MSPTPEKAELDEIELNLNYRFVPRLRRLIANLSPTSAAAVPSDLTPALRQAIVDIVDSTRGKRAVKGGTECRLCEAWDEYLAAQPKAPSPTNSSPVVELADTTGRGGRQTSMLGPSCGFESRPEESSLQTAPRPTPAETPAPQAKRLDARMLSKADLDRLSSVAWNYARESTAVQVRDYLQDVASLRGHIDALEAEAAAREEQVRELVEATKAFFDKDPRLSATAYIANRARVMDALAALTNGAGA